MARHRDGGGQTSLAAFKIRKPTIAAINGHAIGIGESAKMSAEGCAELSVSGRHRNHHDPRV
jgi:hypothetical protein